LKQLGLREHINSRAMDLIAIPIHAQPEQGTP
jgi:hypothetical protein